MIYKMYVIPILAGYFLGSIPWAYILTKHFKNIDITTKGSGNLGTTNVYRTSGIKVAVLVYILDMLKGLLPIVIGRYYGYEDIGVIASVFAVIGHCYSPFMKFKGGKGVAVSSGMILAISPVMFLGLLIVQFLLLFITRIMSIASVSSAILFPITTLFMNGIGIVFYSSLFIGLFVVFKHKDNIKRLMKGEEKKLI